MYSTDYCTSVQHITRYSVMFLYLIASSILSFVNLENGATCSIETKPGNRNRLAKSLCFFDCLIFYPFSYVVADDCPSKLHHTIYVHNEMVIRLADNDFRMA
jgi:hypothetical protein